MASSVITVNRDTKPGYYPIFYGMWLTLRNMLETLFVKGRSATIEYPEKKRNISSRYRGVHLLTAREDGTPKCVACYMCATVCPAECIYIEAGERPEKTIEKYPTRFEIDLLRCVYCGFCVDACPEEAILMSRENDLVVNPIKGKQLTNIRTTSKDEAVRLTTPKKLTLEQSLGYIADDEYVEVTPKNIRLRKIWLDPNERKKQMRATKAAIA